MTNKFLQNINLHLRGVLGFWGFGVLIKASTTVQSILIRAQSFGALIPLLRWIITTFTRRTCVWHKTEVFFGKLKLICA